MKKILIFTIMILALLMASAQDRKATSLLNEVAEKTQSYEHIRIEFEYKMINQAQGIDETLDGTLFSKGDKYKLDIAGQQIISDGKTMWTFLESVNEVQINEPMEDEEGFNPRIFLQSWSDRFKARILSETADETLLELLPTEDSPFTKVHVKVNKNKNELKAITMFDGNNTEFVYSIKRFITNQPIADNEFSFNPQDYPGVEVIDLR
jgi:outer membrane lipoprotein-sorting protein